MKEYHWTDDSACKGAPEHLFIPTDGMRESIIPSPQAKAYCDRCSVLTECLNAALKNGEIGVWGGTSTWQRIQMKRKRKRQTCPSCESTDLVYDNTIELCLACGVSWATISDKKAANEMS